MGIRGVAPIPLSVPAVTQNGTLYTTGENNTPVKFRRATGSAALWISTTAGQIDVYQQISLDGEKWFDPKDSQQQLLGKVVVALTVNTGVYIVFVPVMAPYIRFKIVEKNVAATTVAMKLVFQEENN